MTNIKHTAPAATEHSSASQLVELLSQEAGQTGATQHGRSSATATEHDTAPDATEHSSAGEYEAFNIGDRVCVALKNWGETELVIDAIMDHMFKCVHEDTGWFTWVPCYSVNASLCSNSPERTATEHSTAYHAEANTAATDPHLADAAGHSSPTPIQGQMPLELPTPIQLPPLPQVAEHGRGPSSSTATEHAATMPMAHAAATIPLQLQVAVASATEDVPTLATEPGHEIFTMEDAAQIRARADDDTCQKHTRKCGNCNRARVNIGRPLRAHSPLAQPTNCYRALVNIGRLLRAHSPLTQPTSCYRAPVKIGRLLPAHSPWAQLAIRISLTRRSLLYPMRCYGRRQTPSSHQ